MTNTNKEVDLLDILSFEENLEDKEEINESFDILENIGNTENNYDILNFENLEKEDIQTNDILSSELGILDNEKEDILNFETQNKEILEENKISRIKELFSFSLRYMITSGTIFALLLLGTNYSAYFEIAKSYINSDELKQANADMINSMDSTKIDEEAELNSAKSQEDSENKNFHSMTKMLYEANNENINLDIDIAPYENRIVIPKIAKNIPLVNVENKQVTNVKELEDVFMEELVKGVIRYPGSGIPGEDGNMFVFGHSSNFPWIKGDYNDVFALLDKVVFGDEIIVYYNQKKYTYKVREKTVIKPGEVSILKRNNGKSEVTLMTCYPIGTSINRLLVIGELQKD